MTQILLHLWGDYLLQSQWMADNKAKHWHAAIIHATFYSLPFLLIGSWQAVLVIWATHAVIDRYRLARFVVWAKNFIGPKTSTEIVPHDDNMRTIWETRYWLPWNECSSTGYPPTMPDGLPTLPFRGC